MAAKVVWRDQAKDDLKAILEYIEADSPGAALRYIEKLETACHKLADFPFQGPRYDEIYRILIVGSHIAFYRYEEERDTVIIVTVLHGERDIPNILGKLRS